MKDTIRVMSGHSKWSKVKHQKETTDAVKGAAFTKASRAITIAVQEGGGITDPQKNYHLRLALEKAREVNMPRATIERAIEHGLGASGTTIESALYEGYGPGGVAILIRAQTDNRARTVSEVKHTLERFGGRLASPGSVRFLFEQKGALTTPKGTTSFDRMMEIALEVGAVDVTEQKEVFELTTEAASLMEVRQKLDTLGVEVRDTNLVFRPTTFVEPQGGAHIGELVDALSGISDVVHVSTNLRT